MAHDQVEGRLYIHCLGTVGVPEESALTVYDTSSVPWTEVAGSPLDIDVPANNIVVDPVTGRLYGVSLSRVWGVTVGDSGISHLPNSPLDLDGTGSDLGIDPSRGRLYFNERRVPGPQVLRALSVDDLTDVVGSPVEFTGTAAGDLAVNPVTGDVYVVDFGTATLHSVAPEPLALRDTCGTGGCSIPTTETGLGLDHEASRLFIPFLPDPENPDTARGRLTVWDISDPAGPSEVTDSTSRPQLGYYPIWSPIY
jgi:hypothetical protein